MSIIWCEFVRVHVSHGLRVRVVVTISAVVCPSVACVRSQKLVCVRSNHTTMAQRKTHTRYANTENIELLIKLPLYAEM